MSIDSVTARPFGAFASLDRALSNDSFSAILSLMGPKDLACVGEKVCKSWAQFLASVQWKKECKLRLNVCANIDPKNFLLKDWDYKKGAFLASPKLFNSRLIEDCLPVKMGPVPSDDTLMRSGEADPCDQTATIGQNFFWFDIPEYYEIADPTFPYVLEDVSNEGDFPRLMPRKEGDLISKVPLKVVPTLHNICVLFAHPKKGNPSAIKYRDTAITKQHWDKRIPPGRVCMRGAVIEKGETFPHQQTAAAQAGVVISPLGRRIIFNFLKHVSSGKTNAYPDGQDPFIFARTATLTANKAKLRPFGCGGGGGLSGIEVHYFSDDVYVGVAVELPAKENISS